MKRVLTACALMMLALVAGCGGGGNEINFLEHLFVTNGTDGVTPASGNAQSVREYQLNPANGQLTLLLVTFGTTAAAPGSLPRDLALISFGPLAQGFLYTAYQGLSGTGNVDQFDVSPSGSVFVAAKIAGTTGAAGAGARGIATHPSKKFIYVSNNTAGSVTTFAVGPNGILTRIPSVVGPPAETNPEPLIGTMPARMAVNPNGARLYIAEEGAGGIETRIIDADGLLADAGGAAIASPGDHPDQVIVDATGHCLIEAGDADFVNTWTLTPAGDIMAFVGTFAVTPVAGPALAEGLALDATNGVLFVAANQAAPPPVAVNGAGLATFTFSAATCVPTLALFTQPAGNSPQNVAVDTQNKFVYVTSNVEEVKGSGRSAIYGFAFSSAGALTPLPGSFFDGGPGSAGADDAIAGGGKGGADGIVIQGGLFPTP